MGILNYVVPFILGVIYLFTAVFQATNTIYRRWKMAFVTSIIISACAYVQMKYVASNDNVSFIIFALGAAFGSSLGNIFGNRLGSK